ncbi:hypothetical protein Taro_000646 [Colocasia esculenta]|uniref:Uncharacterized protein n=1 Tax=Colocasia esculenta TaxID=4460 RepID=A0A843TDL4_COLES|nr:hypothetical protein [Colocasia esculenta]
MAAQGYAGGQSITRPPFFDGEDYQYWKMSLDTRSGSVDTRDSSQKTFWPIWDSVSTLDQLVSTLEAFPEHLLGCFGTVCRH